MSHIITEAESGRRLVHIVRGPMQVSYSQLKHAKWNGGLLLDGAQAHADAIVHAGQLVEVLFAGGAPVFLPSPYNLPLCISYEDAHLLVVDKPAPLPVQCSAGRPDDTLENALFSRSGCPADYVYRPVNRLDKGTSGLMLVAKTPHAQQLLQRLLHTEDMVREYLAVTEGIPQPPSGIIDRPIGKCEGATVKRCVSAAGRPSVTHYETAETCGGRALVRLRLETGRTHQIRVHLQSLGCPVCGDFLYGTELDDLPGRFALHSYHLRLRHPITGEMLEWTSPLPPALRQLLTEGTANDAAEL